MMNTEDIKNSLQGYLSDNGLFLVEAVIGKDDEITVTVESEEGTVTLDDCVNLSHAFEGMFDREAGDYSLTVSSAGLDQPFKVLRQYVKAIGGKVEVQLKGGKKLIATLTAADSEGIDVSYTAMEAVEGFKKKQAVEHNDRLDFSGINSVKPFIDFE